MEKYCILYDNNGTVNITSVKKKKDLYERIKFIGGSKHIYTIIQGKEISLESLYKNTH